MHLTLTCCVWTDTVSDSVLPALNLLKMADACWIRGASPILLVGRSGRRFGRGKKLVKASGMGPCQKWSCRQSDHAVWD